MGAGLELAGRYVLEELLGHGNVGEVWRAIDWELGRPVAVKVIRDRIDDRKLATGFQREAQIAASLRHPGITVVHDFGEHDGQPFIVMELLHGRDLGAMLRDAPAGLPVAMSVSLTVQAAEALQAAHAGGVIHRDLKPANLFLETGGQLKICDFGIAVAAGAAASQVASSYIVGSPAYMSPEQCDGEEVGQLSDLYSLGCVLYALLTGQPPFPVGEALAVMKQHRKATPASLRALRPDVPTDLDQLVLELLAKDPAQRRPRGAGDLADMLKALQAPWPVARESATPAVSSGMPARAAEQSGAPGIGAAELRDLIEGRRGFRDVLGLLTAAGDGLTLPDLEELTEHVDLASYEIQDVLRDGADRIFAARAADWDAQHIYLLAGEALRADAAAVLGAGKLSGYRQQLHEWAGRYQQQGWPAATPGYLLAGYPRMLCDAGEIERLAGCATDPVRHDRMFVLSGGDSAALTEIAAAQDAVLAQDDPDLHTMARLAVHRSDLAERGAAIPVGLPAVWISLNQPDRGENLARSITSPGKQAQALAAVSAALATAGLQDRAQRAAAAAEAAARSLGEPGAQAQALTAVAATLARPEPGSAAPDTATRRNARADRSALSRADDAADLASAGLYDQAEDAARSIADPIQQAQALTAVARALAAAGLHERAATAAMAAEAAVRSAKGPGRDRALADLVIALTTAGLRDRAEQVWRCISEPRARDRARAGVAWASPGGQGQAATRVAGGYGNMQRLKAIAAMAADLAQAGLRDQAEVAGAGAIASAMTGAAGMRYYYPASELAKIALVLAKAGLREQAIRAFIAAWKAAPSVVNQAAVSQVLAEASPSLRASVVQRGVPAASPGERAAATRPRSPVSLTMAKRMARTAIRSASKREDAVALADVAVRLASAGFHEQAEDVARSITEPRSRGRALTDINLALADGAWTRAIRGTSTQYGLFGSVRREQTEMIARSISHPQVQARALADVALALSITGYQDQAEEIARSISEPQIQARALTDVAVALSETGSHGQAVRIARSISEPLAQTRALASLVSALARAGRNDQAGRTVGHVLAAAPSITDPAQRVPVLAAMAVALTAAGLNDSAADAAIAAEVAARAVTSPDQQAPALAAAARALAGLRGPANAASYRKLARSMIALAWIKGPWELPLHALSAAAPPVLEVIAALTVSDHASSPDSHGSPATQY